MKYIALAMLLLAGCCPPCQKCNFDCPPCRLVSADKIACDPRYEPRCLPSIARDVHVSSAPLDDARVQTEKIGTITARELNEAARRVPDLTDEQLGCRCSGGKDRGQCTCEEK